MAKGPVSERAFYGFICRFVIILAPHITLWPPVTLSKTLWIFLPEDPICKLNLSCIWHTSIQRLSHWGGRPHHVIQFDVEADCSIETSRSGLVGLAQMHAMYALMHGPTSNHVLLRKHSVFEDFSFVKLSQGEWTMPSRYSDLNPQKARFGQTE